MTYITRSQHHEYTYQGVTYPGVTGILKIIDKSGPLMAWAARQTAQAALALPLGELRATVGDDGAIAAMTSRANWQRDEAAALGTQVHAMAELVVRGAPTPPMNDTVRAYVLGYAKWWQASGWSVRAVEAMIVNTAVGYGGTLDLLARDQDGRTVLADIKTGRAIYHETALQLAAYGMGEVMEYDDHLYVVPPADRHVVIHVTADQVREVELSVGESERNAFKAAVRLTAWRESMKGKVL